MNLSFLEIFTLLAIIHCFVLSLVILLSKFFRSDVNKYLGLSLLVISLVGLNNWFWDIDRHPLIIGIFDLPLWQFLYPATLLIFFVKASKTTDAVNRLRILPYVPFAILSICNVIISLDNNFGLIQLPISEKGLFIYYFYQTISLLTIVFTLILTAISFRYVFVKMNERSGKWLQLIWIFLYVLVLYGVILECYRFIYSERLPLTYLWVLISIFIYWLIYTGIYRFKLSNEQYEIRQLLKNSRNISSIEENNQTSPYLSKLEELIQKENIHRNPNLSRDDVAEKLGISGGYLSQLLNNRIKKSFSDYINFFRVEDAKRMIRNPEFDKYNLVSIGLEAGFNSKTAFYAGFKKETGITPSEYKKSK